MTSIEITARLFNGILFGAAFLCSTTIMVFPRLFMALSMQSGDAPEKVSNNLLVVILVSGIGLLLELMR